MDCVQFYSLFGAVQLDVFFVQLIFRFNHIRIVRDAVNRAYLLTLRLIVMANTLGALVGIYLVNIDALRNRVVRALRFTDITIDALVGDLERH